LVGLAVREERWSAVHAIARRKVDGSDSWLVLAAEEASAARVLVTEAGTDVGVSGLIQFARWYAVRITALRTDVGVAAPAEIGSPAERSDPLMDSICQADLLICVDLELSGSSDWYPQFGGLFATRVKPILGKLATDPDLRVAIGSSSAGNAQACQSAERVLQRIHPQFQFKFDHHEILKDLKRRGIWPA
jgi:hypothetical protein